MYKLICCDLDETLLNKQNKVGARNLAAIQKCRDLGVKFVPTSGRGYCSMQTVLRELGQAGLAGQYTICYNGGAIFENNGRLLACQEMPYPLAEQIFERGQEMGLGMQIYTEDSVYAYQLSAEDLDFCRGRVAFTDLPKGGIKFLEENGAKFAKILYSNSDYDQLLKSRELLADLASQTEISISSNRFLEINPAGVSKGQGLQFLARQLGIAPAETLAIGDSLNDLSMLKAARTGVGVANAVAEIRPACDYICQNDHDHGGVAEALERFVLPAV
ncbi:haloacid dehalogenase [Lactobacillus nasalidis]|uniref:Haloacid dehalogenase n=1 Tax=Lactobacillus nasalidis TaxID=2797258 RepID=A0ABQ3W5J5_9LACO|nr:Cof-type HAD-IIB family hydrolase [Lactobacillus nasalidis]GHV97041.1 haloacid dehalogenase [Lactobacillus nasalidis]GHW00270.1 haloacid dehalogenase [Lactobacillus nasalidis]GHW01736.1 haloacid dehalogenase [Lactobacillus nasalidis]